MTEIDQLRLEKARLQAKCAVLMQTMVWLARNGQQERAAAWVKAADDAAKNVRLEDLVVARVNGNPSSDVDDELLPWDEEDARLAGM